MRIENKYSSPVTIMKRTMQLGSRLLMPEANVENEEWSGLHRFGDTQTHDLFMFRPHGFRGTCGFQDFCNTTGHEWPEDWTQVFDKAVGEDIAAARSNFVTSKNFFWCFAHLSRFLRTIPVQHGGGGVLSAEQICRLGFFGPEFDDELARIRKVKEERGQERELVVMKRRPSNRATRVRKQESRAKRRAVKKSYGKDPITGKFLERI